MAMGGLALELLLTMNVSGISGVMEFKRMKRSHLSPLRIDTRAYPVVCIFIGGVIFFFSSSSSSSSI